MTVEECGRVKDPAGRRRALGERAGQWGAGLQPRRCWLRHGVVQLVLRAAGVLLRECQAVALPPGDVEGGRLLVAGKFIAGETPVRLLDNLSLTAEDEIS